MSDEPEDIDDEDDREYANLKRIKALFDKFDDDFLEFEKVPAEQRRHHRPDVCAFLYLDERFGGDVDEDGTGRDAVVGAGHDEIWLDWAVGKLFDFNEEDALYLSRCGIRCDGNAFAMFV